MDIETKKTVRGSSQSSKILVFSTCVLTLLLTITVTAVVYLSVWQQNTVSHLKNTTPEFVRHGTLQLVTDGEKKAEEVSFYKEDKVVTYKEFDGTFRAHDLNKGIYYSKDSNNGQCYLLPLSSTAEMGRELEDFLGKHDNIKLTSITEEFKVLEGKIIDISFIPSAVQIECHGDYRWLANSAPQDGKRKKRQTTTTETTTITITITTTTTKQ